MMPERVDVAIVGGRCAGSAAAATYARAGRSALVLERTRFPAETLSSHTMFESHLDEIKLIGAEEFVRRLDPPDLRTCHIEFGDGTSDPCVLHQVFPQPFSATSVRRYLLDQALVDNARAAGAEVREQCEVIDLVWRGGRVTGLTYRDIDGTVHTVEAALVLGADGQFSTVADLVGAAEPYRYSHSPRGAVYRYLVDPVTDEPDATTVYHWRTGSSLAFGFPTTPRGQILVMFIDDSSELALARRDPEAYWQGKLAQNPAIAKRLSGATEMEPLRISDALSSYFRHATGPGWALIGDAGHFKNPIIGQGIRDAVWAGRTVAEHTAGHLDRPAELDRALRRWEAARERECLMAYQASISESTLTGDSDGVQRLASAFTELDIDIVSLLATRGKVVRKLLRPTMVPPALLHVLRTSPEPKGTTAELFREVRKFAGIVWTSTTGGFRARRGTLALEYQDEGWPRMADPVSSRRPSC
jgi:flavin-dependent dehydrogenase